MQDPHDLRSVPAGDLALAVVLALLPLLPFGPRYLGLPAASYAELVVVALAVLWVGERWRMREHWSGRRGDRSGPRGGAGTLSLAWAGLLVAVLGAGWLGLVAENELGSPVFLAHLAEAPWRLFRPTDMATYPLHPLRVMLTFAEGLLAFLIVRDLCRNAPDPGRRARVALAGWLTGLGAVSAIAVIQHQTELALHPYWVRVNPELVRAHSTFDDPNALGSFLVLGLGLLAGRVLTAPGGRRRLLWGGLTLLAIVALWTTKSRAAWGAVVLGTMVALAVLPAGWLPPPLGDARRSRLLARVGLGVIVVAVGGMALLRASTSQELPERRPSNTLEVILDTLDPRQPLGNVLKGRLVFWSAATGMFREHPVAGVGLGRFPRLVTVYEPETPARENAHNLYLQMAAETGSVGVGLFLLVLATGLGSLALALRAAAGREPRLLATGAVAGGVGFCLTMLTGHVLLLPSGQLVWASALALVLVIAEVDPATGPEGGPGSVAAGGQAGSVAARTGFPPRFIGVALAACSVLVVYGVAARNPPSAADREPSWGYTWGLYPTETDAHGRSFRWTRGQALLDLDLPAGAAHLELPIAVPHPVRRGGRTVVRIQGNDVDRTVSPAEGTVEVVRLPLSPPQAGQATSILVRIRVEPTWVPAAAGASGDSRELGAQVFEPRIGMAPEGR